MSLTKQHLQNNFNKAREADSPYVFIGISAEGVDEVIVIPKRSFEDKENFYLSAYDENLNHVMNKKVYIRGFSFGDVDEIRNII
ncbi:hypothetical protein [Sporosarcina sp. P17b]|uniref:hypothetical protein n=1 Tax=Sporosarcina sp. P17b TaxID=2048260 RepID=UPI000C16883D|nr:hypothetical protein [Sporosarcina sp. P17b]PIC72420.1 hypothetical protein CSV76_15360 [Sporosarcina sp. P17b]